MNAAAIGAPAFRVERMTVTGASLGMARPLIGKSSEAVEISRRGISPNPLPSRVTYFLTETATGNHFTLDGRVNDLPPSVLITFKNGAYLDPTTLPHNLAAANAIVTTHILPKLLHPTDRLHPYDLDISHARGSAKVMSGYGAWALTWHRLYSGGLNAGTLMPLKSLLAMRTFDASVVNPVTMRFENDGIHIGDTLFARTGRLSRSIRNNVGELTFTKIIDGHNLGLLLKAAKNASRKDLLTIMAAHGIEVKDYFGFSNLLPMTWHDLKAVLTEKCVPKTGLLHGRAAEMGIAGGILGFIANCYLLWVGPLSSVALGAAIVNAPFTLARLFVRIPQEIRSAYYRHTFNSDYRLLVEAAKGNHPYQEQEQFVSIVGRLAQVKPDRAVKGLQYFFNV